MKVGIDFGTTNCTIGNLRPERGRSVSPPYPSIGAWRNGEVLFGNQARDLLRSKDLDVHPVRDLKLYLGKNDYINFGKTSVAVVDLAAKLFRHLIEKHVRTGKVDSAIIATPVRVQRAHRIALRKAAELAGIMDVQLVYEPTAALIGAQRFETLDAEGQFLVIDWGGGTLDIAVIRCNGERYHELAVGGDVAGLGGTQMDISLTRQLLDSDPLLRKAIVDVPSGEIRLRDEIEDLKMELLGSLDGRNSEPAEVAPLWLNELISLDAGTVFDIIDTYADRAAKTITAKLKQSRIGLNEITHILFAGGVCQAPEIQRRIISEFPNASRISHIAGSKAPLLPQELTGAGCTEITAKQMMVELGANVGIRQSDDSVCVLLEKGLPIRINTFRKAQFMVTDPMANEAVLDVGLIHGELGQEDILGWHGGRFESLDQLFVPVSQYENKRIQPVLDYLDVAIGIDENLSVALSASAWMSAEDREHYISAIPLVLSFKP